MLDVLVGHLREMHGKWPVGPPVSFGYSVISILLMPNYCNTTAPFTKHETTLERCTHVHVHNDVHTLGIDYI